MKLKLNSNQKEVFSYIQNMIGVENKLYLVGGSVRDSLLNISSSDLDFVTSFPSHLVNKIFPDSLYFEKFGTNSFKYNNFKITIATFRKENEYQDFRHPNKIKFVSTIKEEYLRRDFTINCLYASINEDIVDPTKKGIDDINNKIIRLIGDKEKRIIEDPLRIIRAYRFKYNLNFEIENETNNVINKHLDLLKKLNINKINEELSKSKENKNKIMEKLHIDFI